MSPRSPCSLQTGASEPCRLQGANRGAIKYKPVLEPQRIRAALARGPTRSGSRNRPWDTAEEHNAEKLLAIDDQALAVKYAANWE